MEKLHRKLIELENILYKSLNLLFSSVIGYLLSRVGISNSFSPFSVSVLSVIPFSPLSSTASYVGVLYGLITKDFSIYNFKYICSNTLILILQIIFSKKNYKHKVYTPIIPGVICFVFGAIFMLADEISLYSTILLVCEATLCSCTTYFVKYFFDSIEKKSKLDFKDIVSLNITLILLIWGLDNYYFYGFSLSVIFVVLIVQLASHYLTRGTAIIISLTESLVISLLHPENEFMFLLLFIPSLICISITKFERKYCVASFYLPYLSMFTISGVSIFNLGLLLSPIVSSIIYILLPKQYLEKVLSKYFNIYKPKQNTINKSFNDVCDDYCKYANKLSDCLSDIKIKPIINDKLEYKIKKSLFSKGCRDIQLANYFNESGYQIVSVSFKNENSISKENLKNEIERISKHSFNFVEEKIIGSTTQYRFEQADNYKIDCFALFKAKNGEQICGDTVSAFKTPYSKYIMILSDGMGSGKDAYTKSNNTMSLLKKTLKSGMDISKAITAVNASLCVIKDEIGFATIDLCSVCLKSGKAEFVKCGAYHSFVIHDKKITRIDSGGNPSGLCEEVSSYTCSCDLYDNDLIIMMSDGVSEAIDDIQAVMLLNYNDNLKSLSNKIIDTAYECTPNDLDDDITVFVARINKTI